MIVLRNDGAACSGQSGDVAVTEREAGDSEVWSRSLWLHKTYTGILMGRIWNRAGQKSNIYITFFLWRACFVCQHLGQWRSYIWWGHKSHCRLCTSGWTYSWQGVR